MKAEIKIFGKTADIDFGKKDISGDFIASPNGKYHLLADMLYSETSEECPYCVVVFTDTEVIYRKILSNDVGISDLQSCKVFDDASCAYLTDDGHFVVIGPDGKQRAKRKTPELLQVEYFDTYVWGEGYSDDGDTVVWLFDFSSMNATTKKIPSFIVPDAEEEERELSADEACIIRNGHRFIVGYDDGVTCAAYDITLVSVKPTDYEIKKVFEVQAQRVARENAEREKRHAERDAHLESKLQEHEAYLASKLQKFEKLSVEYRGSEEHKDASDALADEHPESCANPAPSAQPTARKGFSKGEIIILKVLSPILLVMAVIAMLLSPVIGLLMACFQIVLSHMAHSAQEKIDGNTVTPIFKRKRLIAEVVFLILWFAIIMASGVGA